MQVFKRSTAWMLVLCLVLSLALSVGPMAPKVDAAGYDPYVFYFGPASSLVPAYYRDYAKRFVGWSSHMLYEDYEGYQIVQLFNLTNVEEILPTKPANFDQDRRYASESAFCADLGVSYVYGHSYRAVNLEDSHFGKNADKVKHIRAIIRKAMPNIDNAAAIQKAANEYFGKETVKGLTNAELASAVQAAVWYYANSASYGYYNEPYVWTADFSSSDNSYYWSDLEHCVSKSSPLNVYETGTYNSENNVNKVFQYMINLPGENAHDTVLGKDALSLEKSAFTGNVSNGNLTLFVDIDGIVDGDDELTLSAKCGDVTESVALGKNGVAATADGLFPITLSGISAEDCSEVDLELTGTQTVNDAVFFEAKPIGNSSARYSSQGMTGYGATGVPVEAEATVNPVVKLTSLEITKVDAKTGNPLSGVSFNLYMKQDGDDLKIGSYITDGNGKISVTVSEAEEYYFVETEPLAGYEAVNGNVAPGQVPNSWNAGSLEVSKKLINETPAQVGETFNFKLTLDLSTAPIMSNGLAWMTAEYLLDQLESSKELTWSASGNKLTATFTLNADETVTLDGIPLDATYTLEEVMTAEDREWFTVTTKVDNGTAQKGNTAEGTIAAKNAVLFTNSVVTGEVELGELAVSKKLVNESPAEVGETFNFKITLDLSTADAITNGAPWMDEAYLMDQISCTEKLNWTKKNEKYTATFTVDADETVTIKGIAQGTTYTVEEVLTAEDLEWFTVTSKVDSGAAKDSNIAEGSIAAKNAVLFTNTVVTTDVQLSKLAVSKKLINTTPAQVGETFNFKITLDLSTADVYQNAAPWLDDEYLLGKISSTENLTWTEEDGKYTATFTVDADETVVIQDIAQGTAYTLEEILTEEDRAWFSVTSKVGNEDTNNSNMAQGSIANVNAVLFTNTVVAGGELRMGDLAVSKKLVNETPAQVGETFNFEVSIDLSDADVYDDPAPWMNDEYLMGKISCDETLTWTEKDGKYTATFTVDADETVTIRGLAYGVTYTVKEIVNAQDRERFTVTSQVNSEEEKISDTATGTVAQRNAVLFTNTVVTQDVELGSLNVSKKLVNTTPAEVGETFNFQITIDLSTADVYTDSVFWMNDEYLLGLIGSSENLTWTAKDGKYTAAFTVDADETVTIEGIAQGTTYTVEEILTAEDREWFTVTSQVGSNAARNSTIAQGSVAEENAVLFTNTVVTGPELKLGDPSVSKKLINTTPAEVRETFSFQITMDFSTADVYTDAAPWMNDEYLMSFVTGTEELTWTEKDGKYTATFTVNAEETFTVAGVAYGTTYTVQEIFTENDRERFAVTWQIGDGHAMDSDTVESTVSENNDIVFTNTVVTQDVERSSLNVSKKLVNTTPAQVGETFNFQITLDLSTADAYTDPVFWMNDEYLLSLISSTENLTWTAKDGKYTATFTVDADETVTIEGIAQGTTYTVEEVLTAEERAQFTVTAQVGNNAEQNSAVAQGSIAELNAVLFTNTVVTQDVELGSLDVSKKLVNTTPAKVGETFNFQITLDMSTANAYTDPVFWMNDDYLMSFISSTEDLIWTAEDGKFTATFTVDADETVTIEGIAQGVTYTVQEILTEEDRAWFTTTSQIGEEEAKASDTAESTVAEDNAVLFTNSVVTGIGLDPGTMEIAKKLTDADEAKNNVQFTFRLTLDLSEADIYQDPAPWMYDEYLLDKIEGTKDLTWTKVSEKKYTATFTLKADETIFIDGIAEGTGYTLEEILSETDRNLYRVSNAVTTDGETVESKTSLATGSVGDDNEVIFTNKYLEPIPVTDDLSLTAPLVLCLMSVLMGAVLMLNKRRLIG